MEERIYIYHFKWRASIWWKHLVKLKYIDEENITWRKFKKYFQQEYLPEKYYDNKMEEFFEVELRNITMDPYEKIFIEILTYVDYIRMRKFSFKFF